MFESFIFPVEKKPIHHAGRQTKKSKIIRTDTNNVVSVVSNDYLLIPNRLVIDSIMKEFHSYIDTSQDKYMRKKLFCNERYTTFELALKYNPIEIRDDDAISATIRVENSYDTTKALTVSVNALRLVCSNGIVANREIFASKVNHIGNLSPEDVVEEMIESVKKKAYEEFVGLGKFMKKMTGEFLTEEMKQDFVKALIQQPAYISKGIISEMEKNKPETLWDLYNCVTFVTTHMSKPGRHNTFKIEDKINKSILSMVN